MKDTILFFQSQWAPEYISNTNSPPDMMSACRIFQSVIGLPFNVTDWKIRHSDIMSGGELVFEMYPGAKVQ